MEYISHDALNLINYIYNKENVLSVVETIEKNVYGYDGPSTKSYNLYILINNNNIKLIDNYQYYAQSNTKYTKKSYLDDGVFYKSHTCSNFNKKDIMV
jgi:hypothetical protein